MQCYCGFNVGCDRIVAYGFFSFFLRLRGIFGSSRSSGGRFFSDRLFFNRLRIGIRLIPVIHSFCYLCDDLLRILPPVHGPYLKHIPAEASKHRGLLDLAGRRRRIRHGGGTVDQNTEAVTLGIVGIDHADINLEARLADVGVGRKTLFLKSLADALLDALDPRTSVDERDACIARARCGRKIRIPQLVLLRIHEESFEREHAFGCRIARLDSLGGQGREDLHLAS